MTKLADKVKDVKPEDIVEGLEITINTLHKELLEDVEDLTTKELRRTLKSLVTFIATAQDDRSLKDLRKKEVDFLGKSIYLIDSSRHYFVHILGEIQKEKAAEAAKETEE